MVSLRFLRSAADFAADLAGADDDALGVLDFGLRKHGQEASRWKSSSGELASGCRNMLLGVKHDERLAPFAQRLTAQQVEVLRGGGGLADLHVVARGELQIAFDAGAGVLRALAFIAVRQ